MSTSRSRADSSPQGRQNLAWFDLLWNTSLTVLIGARCAADDTDFFLAVRLIEAVLLALASSRLALAPLPLLAAAELERPRLAPLPPATCFESIEEVPTSLNVAPEMSLIRSVTVFGACSS